MHRLGAWRKGSVEPAFDPERMLPLVQRVREPLHLVRDGEGGLLGVALGGEPLFGASEAPGALSWHGTLPALYPEWLGDRTFLQAHGVRFPYVVGEMAGGIATTALVIESARAGMLGFFGAAGLSTAAIARAIDEIEAALGPDAAWGMNLIHSPNEPQQERETVELFLRRRVRRVSASAFMDLTPNVVRYALSGLTRDAASGAVVRANHVFAKVSRTEVALPFLKPAPEAMVAELVAQGHLTPDEAQLGRALPVAEDITAEADSGGHTDNRPLAVLLPTLLQLRDEVCAAHGSLEPVRIGAAGGLGTPSAVASAFALGAAYVLTGSVNQSAIEAGTSDEVKRMLAQAGMADVVMAPSADMFELGVKVQVLKRGTFFGARARQLHDAYTRYDSLEALPAQVKAQLERDVFREPLERTWERTRRYWAERDPDEIAHAEKDARHRMALCFRAYLGEASRWARTGAADRRLDYQVWCGPAMGAFNAWVKGSFLEPVEHRTVAQIGRNLLEGAAVVTRAQQLRASGVAVAPASFDFRPRPLA